MNGATFGTIERLMRENGIPVPEGRGDAKLEEIRRIIAKHAMSDDLRQRLENLLRC
jgi:hypothetical protein